MIDPQSGTLSGDAGWQVRSGTDEPSFAAATSAHPGRQTRTIGDYTHHVLRGVQLGGRTFNATFIFHNGQIESVTLSLPASGKGWDDWSAADEQQRKRDHDDWLNGQLGPPPYDYGWGTVSSNAHPQGGASTITMRFR